MQIKLKKALLDSQYFKYIYQLAIGSFLAQIITVIVAPLMTRLYAPEEIGIYTLILTVVTIFGPVLCGKYDQAIVAAEDEKEVVQLIVGSIFFSFTFLVLITIGFKIYLSNNLQITDEVGGFAYLVIGVLFLTVFVNILTAYNNRYKEFKIISSVTVTRTLAQNVGVLVFGLLKFGSIGLLLSQLLGMLVGFKRQGKHLYRNRIQLKEVNFTGIKNSLIKYKDLPKFSMPAHFINTAAYSILNFFIIDLFGLVIFGFYAISYRILGLPLNLISMNVSKVFFQRAFEENKLLGNYRSSLKIISLFLLCLSIPMVILLFIMGPFVFRLVFGGSWNEAGVYVQILSPMYGLRFIVSALAPALIISGKQKAEFYISNLFIVASVVSYMICKLMGCDIYTFLTIITATYSLIYIIFYLYIYKLSKGISVKAIRE
ncbi:oligosaccharide flippase family protein [Paenibacillus sp. LMG 31461]|uniref:Oligosaccharide flippase family protein n=1 Tax=Paenibacillus plantarum TaxID=2654975 RepID=A0ABX1X814_9BACL|nr:oligosaccharide flippase family protein [Paenibacillus plantarum]NOU64526.1 oligosaccharide flippase family protein [Paenibacillus plantarum]